MSTTIGPVSNVSRAPESFSIRKHVMVPIMVRFGFPIDPKHKFRLHGRKYQIGPSGVRTLRLLDVVFFACTTSVDANWAFRYRSQIKSLRTMRNPRSLLSLVIQRTDNTTLRILAIWLRGHCGGFVGTPTVAAFSEDADDQMRKEVARALVRMEAWDKLRGMASVETNQRIQRMVAISPPRPFEDRIANFSKHLSRLDLSLPRSHARRGNASQTLRVTIAAERLDRAYPRGAWVREGVQDRTGRPPKSPWFIRMILLHIQRTVARRLR